MKKYECLYIVNINYDSEGTSAVVARVEEVLKSVGAEVVNTQHWGKRKLAYAIDKERYGNYVLLHFQGENPNISEFYRELEIESGVLHYMTIRLDDFPDFETLAVPQAYESERRRPAATGGRRPRRYEDDAPVESKEAVKADDADSVEDVIEEPKESETTEELEETIPTTEEVVESAGEAVAEDADKSADAE